jgi:hypothetical protein
MNSLVFVNIEKRPINTTDIQAERIKLVQQCWKFERFLRVLGEKIYFHFNGIVQADIYSHLLSQSRPPEFTQVVQILKLNLSLER